MQRNTQYSIPYQTLVQQFKASPPGKLYCLHGTKAVFRLSLFAASHALLKGIPIALVDGTNRFDAYYIAEFARRITSQRSTPQGVAPEQLLDNIFVSRAFTCYQMEAAITDRLPAFLSRSGSSVAIIFGLLDTFYDEQAPLFEVKAGLQRIIQSLHQRKEEHVSILLASCDMKLESSERNALFPSLARTMDRVFTVSETDDGGRLVLTADVPGRTATQQLIAATHSQQKVRKEVSHGKNRPYIHNGDSAGNANVVEISPRASQGRSGSAR